MAWEDVGNVISMIAGAAITRLRFVKIGAADNTVILGALSADNCLGVAKEGGATGDAIPVQIDGVVRVETGAAVTRGAQITSDATGRAIDAVATNMVLGTALEAAAGGGIIISVSLSAKTIF